MGFLFTTCNDWKQVEYPLPEQDAHLDSPSSAIVRSNPKGEVSEVQRQKKEKGSKRVPAKWERYLKRFR